MRPRRILLVLLLVFFVLGATAAQSTAPWIGTHYQPGNMAFSLGAGVGFNYGFGVGLYPGAEYIFTKIRPGDAFSLDFGAGVKGAFTYWNYPYSSGGYLGLGAAPMISAHFGLRGFTGTEFADYLSRLDFFTSLGLGYHVRVPVGGSTTGAAGLAIANFSGLNYFLTDSIALTLSSNYWYGFGSTVSPGNFSASIGFVYKIGPAEEIGEGVDISGPGFAGITGELMYTNFAALYWSSIALAGYMPSDETFDEGDGIRFWHRYRSEDDDVDEMEFTRALLHINDDGSRWWRFEFFVDDEEMAFEALVNTDDGIEQLRYIDPESDDVVTHTPSNPYLWRTYEEDDFWTSEELADMRTGTERVRVPAGSFQTERLETSDEGYTYRWWVTDEVPGRVVKFEGISEDKENVSGELVDVLTNVRTPWDIPW